MPANGRWDLIRRLKVKEAPYIHIHKIKAHSYIVAI